MTSDEGKDEEEEERSEVMGEGMKSRGSDGGEEEREGERGLGELGAEEQTNEALKPFLATGSGRAHISTCHES